MHGALALADNQNPRALVDANGNPITLKLTAGQAHDGRSAADMLNTVGQGQILVADSAYDSDALHAAMNQRGARANIKPLARRVNVSAFSPWLYRYRNWSNASSTN
jgi:transposase